MMGNDLKFSMEYRGEETHLLLPHTSSILLTQTLYDLLFQYLTTPEKEVLLENFIKKLEDHIKTRRENPFSIPLSELEFLEEGLEELRLLNWIRIPVQVFKIQLADTGDAEENLDTVIEFLNRIMTANCHKDEQLIYVLPNTLTEY